MGKEILVISRTTFLETQDDEHPVGRCVDGEWSFFREPETNRPLACLYVIKGESYGISICSPKDNPNKEKGKLVAKKRAIKGMCTEKRGQIIEEITTVHPWLLELFKERCIDYLYNKIGK